MASLVMKIPGVESLDHGRELFESAWPIAIPSHPKGEGSLLRWAINTARDFTLPFESQNCGSDKYRVFYTAAYLLQLPRPEIPLIMSCRKWSAAMLEAGYERCSQSLVADYLSYCRRDGLMRLYRKSENHGEASEYFFKVERFSTPIRLS